MNLIGTADKTPTTFEGLKLLIQTIRLNNQKLTLAQITTFFLGFFFFFFTYLATTLIKIRNFPTEGESKYSILIQP